MIIMASKVMAIAATVLLYSTVFSFVPIASMTAYKCRRNEADACSSQPAPALAQSTCAATNPCITHADDPYLTLIPADQYSKDDLPKVFAYPHCYEPHPIATLAADQLRAQLGTSDDLDFDADSDAVGKMMGVLVVRYCCENNNQHLGYLKAHSGTLSTSDNCFRFCPPIYNRFEKSSFYKEGEDELNKLNEQVEKLENDPERRKRSDNLAAVQDSCDSQWAASKAHSKKMQKERRSIRQQKRPHLNDKEYEALDERLKQEGAAIQREMKQLKSQIRQELDEAESAVQEIEQRLEDLKYERKRKSRELQNKLFDQYNFLNKLGERQSLLPIFADTPLGRPPSGAGDCAAPKLFQHAFTNSYEPIAMAEFWWGKSPANEVRRHNLYYPACRGKCQPILHHMLQGMDVESNPMDIAPKVESELETLYEDDYFVVVNKPEGMLSSPGRNQSFSVYSIMKEKYPQATGPLLVHRLDQSTSGVLLIAKDKDTHKMLSAQFIERTIQKRYIALLNGELGQNTIKGNISLPLAPDYINRPMQMISDDGKPAHTIYEILEVAGGLTRIHFYPVTGRTHQLRVHAAHSQGLDCPIVGDDIYGQRDDRFSRLCLHAEYLQFTHPVTQKRMTFTATTPF